MYLYEIENSSFVWPLLQNGKCCHGHLTLLISNIHLMRKGTECTEIGKHFSLKLIGSLKLGNVLVFVQLIR